MENEQLNNLLIQLANKFGVSAEHLYEVMLKQVYVDAILYVVWTLILIVVATHVIGWSLSFWKTANMDYDDALPAVFHLVADTILAMWIVIHLSKTDWFITALVNPEFNIIRYILSQLN